MSLLQAPEQKLRVPRKTPQPRVFQPSLKPLEKPQPANRSSTSGFKETERHSEQIPEKQLAQETPPRDEPGITRRPLPTLKDLLPPITWSRKTNGAGHGEAAIQLDSRAPRYRPYLIGIKRAIELTWQYPGAAIRQGIEGKLVLEFTITENGSLSETTLIQSSGFNVLDDEAIRAVRAASPFQPIPASVAKDRLHIVASFEYHNNRLRYAPAP